MAIQVGGTSVITDARALNNITSVDSATVTALGNAGVGGLSTLVHDQVSFSGATSVQLSLSGDYSKQVFVFSNLQASGSNTDISMRLTNSSSTLITSGYNRMRVDGDFGAGRSNNQNTIELSSFSGVSTSTYGHLVIIIYDGYKTTTSTFFEFRWHAGDNAGYGQLGIGSVDGSGRNNHINIYSGGSNISGYYTSWGVN